MLHPNRANRAWNSSGASYFHVSIGRHNRNDAIGFRGTDGIGRAGYLFHVHNDRAALAVRNTSYVVYDRFSRLDGAGVVVRDISASACRYRNVHTDAIDGTESGLDLHGGQYSHDDVVDRDGASDSVGDYAHVDRRQHDRDHIASVAARQLIDHRMQLYTGRSADQWRGFAALDPRRSEQPSAGHDSTRGHGACRHQHRSDNDRGADAEYVGLRREHDDESGNAGHDGAGQRHGRRGNAGRLAPFIATGLLRGKLGSRRPRAKRPMRWIPQGGVLARNADFNSLFNGAAGFSRYVF
jgi:hypothetical protein